MSKFNTRTLAHPHIRTFPPPTKLLSMKKLSNFILIISFTLISAISSAQIVYITPGGSGTMDGSSWANALPGNNPGTGGYTRLSDTLRHSVSGTQFWVAEGTYLPCVDNDRTKSFEILQNVSVYGGFAGNETNITARDWKTHQTIFSGNIGYDSLKTDNCHHVVKTTGNNWTQVSNLDGLYIADGYALENGAPQNDKRLIAGGIYIYPNTKLTVFQCTIYDNTAYSYGGGLYNEGLMTVSHCHFYNNKNLLSNAKGGAICIFSSQASYILYSVFNNNDGYYMGGAIAMNSNSHIINCLIYNNKATNGGGVFSFSGNNTIRNSTIVNNSGKDVYVFYNTSTLIQNSIIWGGGGILNSGTPLISNSCIQGGFAGTNNTAENPYFRFPNAVVGLDYSGFIPDWTLFPCSPCVNTGDSTLLLSNLTVDLAGNTRVMDGALDMGAYETDLSNAEPYTIDYSPGKIYVNDTFFYHGLGTSWPDALGGNAFSCKYRGKTLLYEVMKDAPAGTNIWVKKGIYTASRWDERTVGFTFGKGVHVLGGFSGFESYSSERDTNNYSILSGNIGNQNLVTDNAYHVILQEAETIAPSDTIYLENIIVQEGYANGTETNNQAGGLWVKKNQQILFENCILRNNYAAVDGGGVVSDTLSILLFHKTRISDNSCGGEGGGLINRGLLFLSESKIAGNNSISRGGGLSNLPLGVTNIQYSSVDSNQVGTPYAYSRGGGIYNSGALNISRSEIRYNTANEKGGGVFNDTGGFLSLNFSQVSYNFANVESSTVAEAKGGGGLYNTGVMNIRNSLIANNKSKGYAGGIYNPTQLINSVIVNNLATTKWYNGIFFGGNGGIHNINPNMEVINCTFANNAHSGIGGTPLTLKNCIVWNNQSEIPINSTLYSCCIKGFPLSNEVSNENPEFLQPSAGIGDTYNGINADWSIPQCSPYVNRGQNSFLLTLDSLDYYGSTRVIDGIVDLGAIEANNINPHFVDYSTGVIYVDTTNQNSNNGNSWENALAGNAPTCRYPGYTMLYQALREAPPETQFWLKNGSYLPCSDQDRQKYFQVINGMKVYGGFSGFENDPAERDSVLMNTIFSGNIGVSADTADNSCKLFLLNDLSNASDTSTNYFDGISFSHTMTNGTGLLSRGGCMEIGLGRKVAMTNCNFKNNFGNQSIIYNSGVMKLTNSSMVHNNSSTNMSNESSATLYVSSSRFQLLKSVISNNNILEVKDCYFNENTGTSISSNNSCILRNNFFHHNYAAPISNSGQAEVSDSRFVQNVNGTGSIYNLGNIILKDCDFQYNKSDSVKFINGYYVFPFMVAPAVIKNVSGNFLIQNCTFFRNYSFGHGGAIYNSGNLTIDSSQFDGNASGIMQVFQTGGMFNVIWTSNLYTGGSISNYGTCSITTSRFINGFSTIGGAFYNNGGHQLNINNCQFSNNFSQRLGGVLMNEGLTEISNSLLINNESGSSNLNNAIISIGNGSKTTIVNSVLSNNKSNTNHGLIETGYHRLSTDVVSFTPDTLTISNSILWTNTGGIANNNNSIITVTNSTMQNGYPGFGNISQDPLFVHPCVKQGRDSSVFLDDWHLRGCSPCINTGNNSLINDPTDLDGNPRIVETVDMGAYEYQTIPTGNWVYGDIEYDNADSTVVDSVMVKLKSGEVVIDSFLTRSPGEFCFSNVQPGNYTIECSSSRSWGGVNSVDALLILKHFTEISQLTNLRLQAAYIDGNTWLNSIDALLIAKRYTGYIMNYPQSDWLFEPANIVVGNANAEVRVKAICRGDVNGSYVP